MHLYARPLEESVQALEDQTDPQGIFAGFQAEVLDRPVRALLAQLRDEGFEVETEAGAEMLKNPSLEKAAQMLKDAGYDGTKVVLMQPTEGSNPSPARAPV